MTDYTSEKLQLALNALRNARAQAQALQDITEIQDEEIQKLKEELEAARRALADVERVELKSEVEAHASSRKRVAKVTRKSMCYDHE